MIVSAPAKEPDATVVLGVNFETYDPDPARHRLERVLHDELPRSGREALARGVWHSPRGDDDRARLTGDQQLLDGPHRTTAELALRR